MSRKYTAQEMRDMAEKILHTDEDWYEDAGHMLLQAADMMERESTREKSSQVGNSAKMREALEEVIDTINEWRSNGEMMEHWQYSELFDIADTALSAPPRNCDVGTAEEQTSRFVDFCYRSKECVSCQMAPEEGTDCILAWAQAPYKDSEIEFKSVELEGGVK